MKFSVKQLLLLMSRVAVLLILLKWLDQHADYKYGNLAAVVMLMYFLGALCGSLVSLAIWFFDRRFPTRELLGLIHWMVFWPTELHRIVLFPFTNNRWTQ